VAELATGIILTAGSMTFVNDWYWTKKPNWHVLVATALGAAVFDGLAHVSSKAAVGLSVVVLLGAATHTVNGHSVVDTVNSWFSSSPSNKTSSKTPTRRVQVA
jgi:hypothetical protein